MLKKSLFAVLLLSALIAHPFTSSAQTPLPTFETFEEDDCVFTLFDGSSPADQGVTCGYVTVPELHAEPDGPTIRLAIAVIPAEATSTAVGSAPAAPDPLFIAQGGPGGSTLDFFGEAILGQGEFADIGRDIVLIEQRGTLYSEPNLICGPEETDLIEQTLELDLSDKAYERLALESERLCKLRLESKGINLSAYNSLENAADMEAVRQALGYDAFNFYGVSYGTLLGLHLMRNHPEHLRSVILDSVVPTQTSFLPEVARSADRAYDELFTSCAADAECNAAFPNLEDRFYDLVAELNEDPVMITVTNDETGQTYNVLYNGDNLMGTIFGNLYVTSILNALPMVIENAENGNFRFIELDLSFRIFDRSFSGGMYNTVICAEDFDIGPEILGGEGIHPAVLTNQQASLTSFLKGCDVWAVPPLDPIVNEPVVSDIPTLLMAGQYDPITPPAFAETAATTLSNSYVYTLPSNGHGVITDGDCALSMVRDFLTTPTQEPDASCIDSIEPLDFVTPAEFVPTNIGWELNSSLFELDDGTPFYEALWEVVLLVGGALLLLSVLLIWPILYLRGLGQAKPASPQPLWVKAAGWFAALNAILTALLLIGTTIAFVTTYIDAVDIAFFGFVPESAWVFVLPFPIFFLAILMTGSMFSAWLTGSWSAARRIYYTLLTIAAVSNTVAIAVLGFFNTYLF